MLMLVMVNAALPVLPRVTVLAALLVPTGWFPNVREVGDRTAAGAMPVPVRGTVCGLPVALSATLMLAVRVPDAVGVNVTLMEHDAPADTDDPQVFVSE